MDYHNYNLCFLLYKLFIYVFISIFFENENIYDKYGNLQLIRFFQTYQVENIFFLSL